MTDGVLHEIGDGHSGLSAGTGGIQTYAAELALRFHASLEDFVVVAPGVEGAAAWDRKVPYRVVRVGTSSDHVPVTAVAALAKLGHEGFDSVFHTQWQTVIATKQPRSLAAQVQLFLAAHGRELLLEPLKHFKASPGCFRPASTVVHRPSEGTFSGEPIYSWATP